MLMGLFFYFLQEEDPFAMFESVAQYLKNINRRVARTFHISTTRVLQIEIGALFALGVALMGIGEWAAAILCWVTLGVVLLTKVIAWQGISTLLKLFYAACAFGLCTLLITITVLRKPDSEPWSNLQKLWIRKPLAAAISVFSVDWLLLEVNKPISLNINFTNNRPYALHVKEYAYAFPFPTSGSELTEDQRWDLFCEESATIPAPPELTVPGMQKLTLTTNGPDLSQRQVEDLRHNYDTSVQYMAAFVYSDLDGTMREEDFCAIRQGVNDSMALCRNHNEPLSAQHCPIDAISKSRSDDGTETFVFPGDHVLTRKQRIYTYVVK